MPKVNLPVAADEIRKPQRLSAAARERRVSEQLITDWERETRGSAMRSP